VKNNWSQKQQSDCVLEQVKTLINFAEVENGQQHDGPKPHLEIVEVLFASQNKRHSTQVEIDSTARHLASLFKLYQDMRAIARCDLCLGFGHNELICPLKRCIDVWSANHGCAKLWDAIKALAWWIEARQRFSHLADFSQLYKTDWWMSNWAELNFEQFAQYK